jgi:hypothetical protein
MAALVEEEVGSRQRRRLRRRTGWPPSSTAGPRRSAPDTPASSVTCPCTPDPHRRRAVRLPAAARLAAPAQPHSARGDRRRPESYRGRSGSDTRAEADRPSTGRRACSPWAPRAAPSSGAPCARPMHDPAAIGTASSDLAGRGRRRRSRRDPDEHLRRRRRPRRSPPNGPRGGHRRRSARRADVGAHRTRRWGGGRHARGTNPPRPDQSLLPERPPAAAGRVRLVGAVWVGRTFNANTGGEQFTFTGKLQVVGKGGTADSVNLTFHGTSQPNNVVVKTSTSVAAN